MDENDYCIEDNFPTSLQKLVILNASDKMVVNNLKLPFGCELATSVDEQNNEDNNNDNNESNKNYYCRSILCYSNNYFE